MKKVIDLYNKLCIYYNDNNVQKLCSLQTFLQHKYDGCKNPTQKSLLQDVINYAAKDYPY